MRKAIRRKPQRLFATGLRGRLRSFWREKGEKLPPLSEKICRTCSHRNWHASFRQILPMTASKFLEIHEYSCGIFPCPRQNLLENLRTIPMRTSSKNPLRAKNEHSAPPASSTRLNRRHPAFNEFSHIRRTMSVFTFRKGF